MDYLLIPEGAAHIPVPYRSTEPYDCGDFMTYPLRKGWTESQLEGADDYGGRSPAEIDVFFQNCLFFGFLTEVFKIGGFELNQDDFVDHEHGVVTTQSLPALFVAWKKKWSEVSVPLGCQCPTFRDHPDDPRGPPEQYKCPAPICWRIFKRGVFSDLP
ncbi:hypothetical protein EUX98_g5713 [Antrodiella citrinella]|uniref:Uncharacterized protein n=1 Tax=Antrodiella citrinella TaxID=2447956 RepID=A0A4S4MQS0_9APHY|nr:hypothetical protein EUX98_g5713 [Antrodiella citrinella]